MKKTRLIMAALLLMLTLTPAATTRAWTDRETLTISVGGTERTFVCCTPDGLEQGRPLMIALHGMTWDADYMRTHFRAESVADTARFCVIYPDGLNEMWDISGTTDTDFISSIIEWAANQHGIDRRRVYLTGFSMGGMMTYHAMNTIADRIAAFAAMSGYPLLSPSYESSRPVPLLHIHGTSDLLVWYSGVSAVISGWVNRNQCNSQAETTIPYKAENIERYRYLDGLEGSEVVLIKMNGVAHKLVNDSIFSAEEVWNFCKRFSLPTDESAIENTPGSTQQSIDCYDLNGRKISRQSTRRGLTIERIQMPDGKISVKKFVR